MLKIAAFSLLAMSALIATPLAAQGIYVGPGGVGVDPGIRLHRDRDRDRDYRYRDREGYYEGRSIDRDRYRHHRDDY